jgi:transposase-like protein
MEQSPGMVLVSKRAQSRSEQEIFDAMEEFERAGNISIKEFAEMHQVSEATFYNWQKRYRAKGTAKDEPKGFIPVSIEVDASGQEGAVFAEYRGIKFYQWVEPSYLKELLP